MGRPLEPLFTSGALITIWCEEPTHFGTGRAVGLVDLPIQRSARTDLPIAQSSSIRGLLRSVLELSGKRDLARQLFGPEPGAGLQAGHVSFSDAKLLALPVRSIRGLFCWLTSRDVLSEFYMTLERLEKVTERRIEDFGLPSDIKEAVGAVVNKSLDEGGALVPEDSENVVGDERKLVLLDGELTLKAEGDGDVRRLAEVLSNVLLPEKGYLPNIWRRRFGVVHDNAFKLATKRGLEIATRVGLQYETKTVREGALWSEEYLPAMSVLFCDVFLHARGNANAIKDFNALLDEVNRRGYFFVGGKESVGKGLVRMRAYRLGGGQAGGQGS